MPILPPPLSPGDTIGVVAPSSPQRDDDRLRRGIAYLHSKGYRVREGAALWNRYGYLAGRDAERAEDLNAMIRDPQVRMIIAGRGGYGATRILDRIDYDALAADPKLIVGFSDVTALNCAVLARAGLVSLSGAMPGVDFFDTIDPLAERSFWAAVAGRDVGPIVQPDEHRITPLRQGVAEGWLLPGNLTLLAALLGTPYMPDPSGAILLIEEIGEEAYRLDRHLSQLDNAGVLSKISGLALGAFTGTEATRVSVDPLPVEEVFDHYLDRAGVPAVGGVLYGHIATKLTLPVGAPARINGTSGTLELLGAG